MLTLDVIKDDEIFMELGDMDVQMMPVDDFYTKLQDDAGMVKMLSKMQRPVKKWVLSESTRRADCTHMHYWKKEGQVVDGNSNDIAIADPLNAKLATDKATAAAVGAPGSRSKPARFVKYTEEEY